MDHSNDPALSRVSAYLRAMISRAADSVRLPPFWIVFDGADSNQYRNYAYPDDDADPDDAAVGALIDAFVSRRRKPRFEYAPALAPKLNRALDRAGFVREGVLPLMSWSPSAIHKPASPAGVVYRQALIDADLATAASVQNIAYGAGEVTAADTERLRRLIRAGGVVALAERDGEAVGSALVTAPIDGVAEIAAVGVLPAARRQGIGGGVTAFLTRSAFAAGVDLPFLMAATEVEARIYASIGFTTFAEMLHTSRPDGL